MKPLAIPSKYNCSPFSALFFSPITPNASTSAFFLKSGLNVNCANLLSNLRSFSCSFLSNLFFSFTSNANLLNVSAISLSSLLLLTSTTDTPPTTWSSLVIFNTGVFCCCGGVLSNAPAFLSNALASAIVGIGSVLGGGNLLLPLLALGFSSCLRISLLMTSAVAGCGGGWGTIGSSVWNGAETPTGKNIGSVDIGISLPKGFLFSCCAMRLYIRFSSGVKSLTFLPKNFR